MEFAGAQVYVALVAVKDEVGEVFESLDGEAVRRAHAVAFAKGEVGAPLGVGRLLPAWGTEVQRSVPYGRRPVDRVRPYQDVFTLLDPGARDVVVGGCQPDQAPCRRIQA
jgi:hypothetical protein